VGKEKILRGRKSPLFIDQIKMILKQDIVALADECLEGTDRFVVDIIIKPDNLILVFIDADSAVTIDHCVELSRFIEKHLDREEEDFELRVSSSGLDQPIKMLRQFKKVVGRSVVIKFIAEDKKNLTGELIGADENSIQIQEIIIKKLNKLKKEVKGEILSIPFSDIDEVKEVIDFN
jgi:ribosome maturation factor RimP